MNDIHSLVSAFTKIAPDSCFVPRGAAPSQKAGVTPDAPVLDLSASLIRPRPLSAQASKQSAGVADAISALAGIKAFGPQFKVVGLSDERAFAATVASLNAVKSKIVGAGFATSPHGFAPAIAFKDELGRVNVRMNRVYDGVPIFGEQIVSHLGADDTVTDMTGTKLPARLPVDTKATITEEAALSTALAVFGARPTRPAGSRLVIIADDAGAYHLAHHVVLFARTETGATKMHYFVDAHSGAMLPLSFDELGGYADPEHVEAVRKSLPRGPRIGAPTPSPAPAIADGSGSSVYSGVVPLATTKDASGKFILRDPGTSKTETRDALNGDGGAGSANRVFTDDNNKWGETTDDARQRAGIDAHYAAVSFLSLLKQLFDRDSIDGKGQQLLSNVHVRENFVNAYWDGDTMNYGDGDGRVAGPMVDRDVGGHEITHGLTQHTSGLIYRNESGALNEAGSDILGSAGLSWFMRGMKDQGIDRDWLLGEDSFTPGKEGDAWRYMDSPTRDKATRGNTNYSRDNYKDLYKGGGDNGGVHINSGIANNFFFLLAAGGENATSKLKVEKGLGMEKALRIYYRAHTVYFTPSTNFAQARVGWEKAAADLYGADSVELKTVREAAAAVGIEAPPPASGGVTLVG